MQCHRAAVTDDGIRREFFAEGRLPGAFGDFQWSLDEPEAFPGGRSPGHLRARISLPMQHAWNAAVAAFAEFIAALVNGELIASGVHPTTGVRCEIDPAEWTRTAWLILDVRNGDLIEGAPRQPQQLCGGRPSRCGAAIQPPRTKAWKN